MKVACSIMSGVRTDRKEHGRCHDDPSATKRTLSQTGNPVASSAKGISARDAIPTIAALVISNQFL
jgi:hypothetical protein